MNLEKRHTAPYIYDAKYHTMPIPIIILVLSDVCRFHGQSYHTHPYICIVYTMAARSLVVVHEWPDLIGHEGIARVVL